MYIKNKIEEILLTDYQYVDCYTVDKLLDLFAVSNNEVAVCDHPFNSVETDKLGNFIRCNKCGENLFKQTER